MGECSATTASTCEGPTAIAGFSWCPRGAARCSRPSCRPCSSCPRTSGRRADWRANHPLIVRAQIVHGMEEAGTATGVFRPRTTRGGSRVWGVDGAAWTRPACRRTRTPRSWITARGLPDRPPARSGAEPYTNAWSRRTRPSLALRSAPRATWRTSPARARLPGLYASGLRDSATSRPGRCPATTSARPGQSCGAGQRARRTTSCGVRSPTPAWSAACCRWSRPSGSTRAGQVTSVIAPAAMKLAAQSVELIQACAGSERRACRRRAAPPVCTVSGGACWARRGRVEGVIG